MKLLLDILEGELGLAFQGRAGQPDCFLKSHVSQSDLVFGLLPEKAAAQTS